MRRFHPHFFLLIPLFMPLPAKTAQAALFEIQRGIEHAEISVVPEKEFTVRLLGKGWYLNRYDSENLTLKYRVADEEHTDFILFPRGRGDTYLFFSFLKEDVYVRVHVSGEPENAALLDERAAQEEAPETGLPDARSETAERQAESAADEAQALKEEPELYYMNRENRQVPVSARDENVSYELGVKLQQKGANEEALKSLKKYLDECDRCAQASDANLRIAGIYLAAGKENEALVYAEKVIQSGSKEHAGKAQLLKGEIAYRQGNAETALLAYKRASEIGGRTIDLTKRMADIAYEIKKYDESLEAYEQCVLGGLASDEIYFRMALISEVHARTRNLQNAYRYYKIIVDAYKNSIHYSFALKKVQFLEKNFFDYK